MPLLLPVHILAGLAGIVTGAVIAALKVQRLNATPGLFPGYLVITAVLTVRRPRRLARHLWRMCFAMFVATGSFFLGQAKVFPEPIRIFPLLALLVVATLVVSFYWLWRVRIRKDLNGIRWAGGGPVP